MKNFFLILFIPSIVFGQNGPDGVGGIDGNTSLVLWLNSESIEQDSGSQAAIWQDKSGFKNHAKAEVGKGPILLGKTINNQNTFLFTPDLGGIFEVKSSESISPNHLSLFVVGKISKKSDPWAGFILKQSGSSWDDGYGICRNKDEKEILAFTTHYNKYGLKTPFNYGDYMITSLHFNSHKLGLFKDGKLETEKPSSSVIKKNKSLSLSVGQVNI